MNRMMKDLILLYRQMRRHAALYPIGKKRRAKRKARRIMARESKRRNRG